MSPSSVNNEDDGDGDISHSPVVNPEEPPSIIQEQDWLTLRRRCELCKQRKVWIRKLLSVDLVKRDHVRRDRTDMQFSTG